MFYKNWPYWLKGGIISFVLLAIAYYTIETFRFVVAIFFLIAPASWLGYEVCFMSGLSCPYNVPRAVEIVISILGPIFMVLAAFLPGAIVGLIYGKVKHKN
ncbi:MAG: hypothetical protein A2998_00685 [Candidatus Staskawiczbacteria bacterium RIFCSPLOWO2_01_FULL_37_25b]|uniref:Uncharacterized protein n=2 Tax=Candidatus Staskawicziibacteriota TaxID=1817916 RepID=A0A1G2HMK8_9BACT|nr:MAG: hypothetical protein A2812_01300 [Candidatus Staskawiczbacteria bacterium RIFCSPHIGHO2_01_FULL_36_16]OGZ72580.1 MAG: hypothetical protein A2998_00685 [Candidatus Staskawiczbacteria bacterium RIFCSPLOWO2_01_FULL_37_25b]